MDKVFAEEGHEALEERPQRANVIRSGKSVSKSCATNDVPEIFASGVSE